MTDDIEDAQATHYGDFGGNVGRISATSEPWWPLRREAPRDAPNIVIVLADDMGFSDLGCYGSEISTPHIDDTAANGVRYTNFHVAPLCSPTRAALLTGLNPHAAGVGVVSHADTGFPGYTGELPEGQPSLAETFRENGYSTFAVGKWHLCKSPDLSEAGDKHSWPLQRGFDQYYGFLEALTNFHHPHRMYEGNTVVPTDEYVDGYYLTDDLTARAVRMIREVKTADPDKPFFLYYSHGAPHAPLHAKRADIAAQRDRYRDGWDVIRTRRLDRQIELGIMPEGTVLPPRNPEPDEDVRAWDELTDDEQTVFARYMECYAAMIVNIDESVGAIRTELERLGQLDNTLILVTSDNGASREGRDRGTTAYFQDAGRIAGKSTSIDDALERLDEIGGPTTWPHYPRGWAMACNTPFRLYKVSTFRGGHSVPLVISWPDKLAADQIVRRQYTHVSDILPTLADLVGIDIPTARNGIEAEPLDGIAFTETLSDAQAPSLHTEQYYECVGHRAYHRGDWHAVTFHEPRTPFSNDRWQLFNAQEDINELRDVADQHPELVAELIAAWETAAWDNRVFPLEDGTGISKLFKPPYGRPDEAPLRILPDTPTLERYRSSRLIAGRSFTIEIELDHEHSDEGILIAHGGQEAGYVIWIEENQLRAEVNAYGRPLPIGDVAMPDGWPRIEVKFVAPGEGLWDITIAVDGQQMASADGIPQFAGYLPFEGIDIGIDRRSPVSWDLYQRRGPFPYSGTLHAVTYIPGPQAPDAEERRIEELRTIGTGLE